jgi:hypothetical protein
MNDRVPFSGAATAAVSGHVTLVPVATTLPPPQAEESPPGELTS